ncbi:hypothetical protein [Rheinheimera texasensis]|uniref:hypothetical protein n=1 Tax=Rheinheimera texasensis TaxID=306205 RepID=UPI0032B15725
MVMLLAVVHALEAKTTAPMAQAGNDQAACGDDQAVKIACKGFVRPKAVFVSAQMTIALTAGSIRSSLLDYYLC